jgi:acetyl esterase
MVLWNATNKVNTQWAKSLASIGLVVIIVDFRNARTLEGYNQFPIGLNDCAEAVKLIAAHKELNIEKIVLQGESGGGNLVLVTALKRSRYIESAIDRVCFGAVHQRGVWMGRREDVEGVIVEYGGVPGMRS